VSTETGLLDAWPEGGPKLLWKTDGLGRGWCSPIVTGGTLHICGDVGNVLRIFAFDLEGNSKWNVDNGKAWKRSFPGSRAACCYSEGMIYQMNGHGRVVCLDAKTGKERWVVDIMERFKAQVPTFGMSECLLVDGENLIVTPVGKKALIAALNKKTGETVWKCETSPEDTETAGYASPILFTLGGRRMIAGNTSYRTFAIDAETGKMLWSVVLPITKTACSTIPVLCGNSLFITDTSVKEQASSLLNMDPKGDTARKAWTLPLRTTSGSSLHVEGDLYIAGERELKGFLCLDPETGKIKAKADKPINASAVWADGKLFVLSADGMAMLLRRDGKRFETLGSFSIGKAVKKDAWAHPVLLKGRLYLRYHDTLFCYDVKGN
jgi:outer membrane protein assembly factor BamB